jgi:hypothetical protein
MFLIAQGAEVVLAFHLRTSTVLVNAPVLEVALPFAGELAVLLAEHNGRPAVYATMLPVGDGV